MSENTNINNKARILNKFIKNTWKQKHKKKSPIFTDKGLSIVYLPAEKA